MSQMQERINEIQAKYAEWCELWEEFKQDKARFERATELMRDLEEFMTEEFLEAYEAIENGEPVDLKTNGEYSIMSEDTIWNAYGDFQRLAWQRLRMATDALNPYVDDIDDDFDETDE